MPFVTHRNGATPHRIAAGNQQKVEEVFAITECPFQIHSGLWRTSTLMNDNPYTAPITQFRRPSGSPISAIAVRPLTISILAWFLILNAVRHAIVLWMYDGDPTIPLDALILSLTIDGCYLLSGWGLLGMRKWAILLYFAAHSITIWRLVLACPDFASLEQQLASIRILWFAVIPIGMLAFAVPRWPRLKWA